MRLNAKQIAHITGANVLVCPLASKELVHTLNWDSRDACAHALYVALPGSHTDGHQYVSAAFRAGAHLALVEQTPSEQTCALARELGAGILEVPNTRAAITQLARAWRAKLSGCVIALTGSSGKTTTKNIIRDVLSTQHSVVATKANQNNELGVPNTLLSADIETEYVVVEMGMRGLGQIEELCSFVKPTMGLVTNVGESHLELLGSRDNIARAKAELFCALEPHQGVAFVNASDTYAPFLCTQSRLHQREVNVVYFGCPTSSEGCAAEHGVLSAGTSDANSGALGANANASSSGALGANAPRVWAQEVTLDNQGRACFTLCAQGFPVLSRSMQTPCAQQRVHLNLRGLHNVSNALAAAAVALWCNMDLASVACALKACVPEAGRQDVIRARAGYYVVDDTYNANPDSMRASLASFCAMSHARRHLAVLGDMGELGEYAQACHAGIGEYAAQLNLDYLICVGELSQFIAAAAREAGMPAHKIVQTSSISDVLGVLDTLLQPEDAVLVKASHFMQLSRVVEGLIR